MEVSNPDRVVYPDDGITKGEVVAYYEAVAPRMLPFIAGRALTVERYPRGTGAKGFMQKNAPDHFGDDLDPAPRGAEGGRWNDGVPRGRLRGGDRRLRQYRG